MVSFQRVHQGQWKEWFAPGARSPCAWPRIYSHRVTAKQTRDVHSWWKLLSLIPGRSLAFGTNSDSWSVLENPLSSSLECGMSLALQCDFGQDPDGAIGGPQEVMTEFWCGKDTVARQSRPQGLPSLLLPPMTLTSCSAYLKFNFYSCEIYVKQAFQAKRVALNITKLQVGQSLPQRHCHWRMKYVLLCDSLVSVSSSVACD